MLSTAYDKPLSFSRNGPAKRGQFLDNVKCSGIVGGRLRIAQYAIFSANGNLGQRAIAAPKWLFGSKLAGVYQAACTPQRRSSTPSFR